MGLTESIEASGKPARVISSLRRQKPEAEMILESLGELHVAGYPVSWEKFFNTRGRVVSVPSYPWQKQRFWTSGASNRRVGGHKWPLIHTRLAASDQAGKQIFEAEIDLKDREYAYLADHCLREGALLPGAAFLEMAIEAGTACAEGRAVSVSEATISQALMLSEKEPVVVQLVLSPEQGGTQAFRISSRPAKDATLAWTTHASGHLAFERAQPQAGRRTLAEAQRLCAKAVDTNEVYERFAGMGMPYGPAFRGMDRTWVGDGQALSKLVPVENLTEAASGYLVHPSTLDAAFQTLFIAPQSAMDSARAYVLASVGGVQVFGKSEARWAHAQLRSVTRETAEGDIVLFDEDGVVVAEVKALRATILGRAGDKLDGATFDQVWRTSPPKSAESVNGRWLLLADEHGTAAALRKWLEVRGAEVVTVARGDGFTKQDDSHYVAGLLEPGPLRRVLTEAFGKSAPKHIVHCFSLDTRQSPDAPLDERAVAHAEELTCTSVMALAQAIAELAWSAPPRLSLVTRGCQPATGSRDVSFPEQALAWGFGVSLMHEMTELKTTLIDLDDAADAAALGCELAGADEENRVALRGKERWVPRLGRHVRPKTALGAIRPLTVSAEEGYALHPSMDLVPTQVPAAGPGQVVIRTAASALGTSDPDVPNGRPPMSLECAGVVSAVGPGVESVRVGDAVVATAEHAFDAYAVTSAELVVPKPASLTFEQTASLPCAAMTVLYALDRVGRLRKGDRLLIHNATSGIGLAAVQYAKHVGAQVLATAETDEKREHLRKLGLEHVYDSRTLAWAESVIRDTSGRGVDVVLNSLVGEALQKGVSVLAPYGRFLDLSRRDASDSQPLLRSNITLSVIALDPLLIEGPPEVRARTLLEDTFRLVEAGALSALPVESFPVSRSRNAFERLARADHVGQVVLTSEERVSVRDRSRNELLSPDKTYLITGGLGGLGLVIGKRMAKLGAKHVALMGRRAPSDDAQKAIGEIEANGARVYTVRGDVADRQSLAAALAELARSAPPVGGVIHSAAVLDDAVVSNLTAARIGPVLAPKVLGALGLDALLPDLGVRVYFGSLAGVLGSAGQAHYAASNAFLDAYAHYHVSQSRHALSLDWGFWSEVGGATEAHIRQNATRQGLLMITTDDGSELFERGLADSAPQLSPMPLDFRQWRQANPQLAGMPFLHDMVASSPTTEKNVGLFDRLQTATTEAARLIVIEEYLRATIADVLHTTPDAVSRSAPFKQLGFDSLMTVSFKNALERDLGIPISAAALFKHHSVERLTAFIASRLDPPRQEVPRVDLVVETAEPAPTASSDANSAALPTLDSMLSELTKGGYL